MKVFQVEYMLHRRHFKFYIYIEDVDTSFNSQKNAACRSPYHLIGTMSTMENKTSTNN